MRVAIIGVALLLTGCSDPMMDACDAAIQGTLKAPSSYKRVSTEGDTNMGYGSLRITYDAVNSFNAPIRSAGTCYYLQNRASWFEDIKPS